MHREKHNDEYAAKIHIKLVELLNNLLSGSKITTNVCAHVFWLAYDRARVYEINLLQPKNIGIYLFLILAFHQRWKLDVP